MATYTILPSSFTAGSGAVSNPSRAYTDTSSTTYASVSVPNAGDMYLGGFDFSTIPSGYIISAITVKIRWRKNNGQADYYAKLIGKSSGTDVALSSDLTSPYPVDTSTFTLTESAATVASYASTLAINFRSSSGSPQGRVYGVEVIVTADKPPVNKVMYGNNTLIDLTADTVTAADVASGKTFHLANGTQGIGTASAGASLGIIERHSTQSSTSSSSYVTFSGLSGEPQAFVVYTCWDIDGGTVGSSLWVGTSAYVITTCCYDGNGISANIAHGDTSYPLILRNNKYYQAYPDITFSYSNGSLTLNGGGISSSTGSFHIGSNNIFRLIYVY